MHSTIGTVQRQKSKVRIHLDDILPPMLMTSTLQHITMFWLPLHTLLISAQLCLFASVAGDAGTDAAHPLLQRFGDRPVLAGAVTVAVTGERTVMQEAVGYADSAAQRPMRSNTMLWIASMS